MGSRVNSGSGINAESSTKAPINWINMILFTATPLFAITLVPLYGFYYGYDTFEWLFFIFMMAYCGFSITAGYHRMWSHKTYQAHPVLRFIFALGGACALQNDVLHWASDHRRHHQYVDSNDRDPYSASRGFWFSHIGWILRDYPSGKRDFSNAKDLQRDPIVMWQHKHYLALLLLMNIGVPAVVGYLHGDIIASLLLAGLLRLVLSQHVTWLINSIAHMWGQPDSRAGYLWRGLSQFPSHLSVGLSQWRPLVAFRSNQVAHQITLVAWYHQQPETHPSGQNRSRPSEDAIPARYRPLRLAEQARKMAQGAGNRVRAVSAFAAATERAASGLV